MKQEAWVKDKFDKVYDNKRKIEKADEKGRFEKDDVKMLNAEHTPTTNTTVNIVEGNIKNKFDEVLANKGRFEKDNVKTMHAEYTPSIHTPVNTVMRNPKNTVKKP